MKNETKTTSFLKKERDKEAMLISIYKRQVEKNETAGLSNTELNKTLKEHRAKYRQIDQELKRRKSWRNK